MHVSVSYDVGNTKKLMLMKQSEIPVYTGTNTVKEHNTFTTEQQ